MSWKIHILPVVLCIILIGCWDEITHVHDCPECEECTDCDCADSGDAGSTAGGEGQGTRPEGYESFGGPCETDAQCTGYDRARCVPRSILGVVAVPGGYCTACCDAENTECASGIQCIGYNDVYLICAAKCTSDDQCRQEEGYACRSLEDVTPALPLQQKFCLPDAAHQTPDPNDPEHDIQCDWTWL
jgi:hypothetical protein